MKPKANRYVDILTSQIQASASLQKQSYLKHVFYYIL